MSWEGVATTLYRAKKLPNGKVVCVDIRVIHETSKVVRNSDEYYKAIGQGWCEHPDEALRRYELAEQEVGNAAAERAAADLKLSALAQQEAADYEKTVSTHVPEIPEARR